MDFEFQSESTWDLTPGRRDVHAEEPRPTRGHHRGSDEKDQADPARSSHGIARAAELGAEDAPDRPADRRSARRSKTGGVNDSDPPTPGDASDRRDDIAY